MDSISHFAQVQVMFAFIVYLLYLDTPQTKTPDPSCFPVCGMICCGPRFSTCLQSLIALRWHLHPYAILSPSRPSQSLQLCFQNIILHLERRILSFWETAAWFCMHYSILCPLHLLRLFLESLDVVVWVRLGSFGNQAMGPRSSQELCCCKLSRMEPVSSLSWTDCLLPRVAMFSPLL